MDDEDVAEFLTSSLVRWVETLTPDSGGEVTWPDLAKGVGIANSLQQLGEDLKVEVESQPVDTAARIKNMINIVATLKKYYEEGLGQIIMVKLPDPSVLALIPPTAESLAQMEALLLLLLGAAVQSDHKQDIIIAIKNLPLDTQHGIVDRIKAITENTNMIWSKDLNNPSRMGEMQRDQMYLVLVEHAARLVRERDELGERIVSLDLDKKSGSEEVKTSSKLTAAENHAMVELAEHKAGLRKLRQQLEEKTEQLSECREELDKFQDSTSRLKAENLELCQDARAAKTYRDELDVLRERAGKVDKLEAEILRYKDKMNDIDFFKSRVEELREDNRILVETKEMLEEQLLSSRKRCESVLALENEMIKYRGDIESCRHQQELDRATIQDLQEENQALSLSQKHSINKSQSLLAEMESIKGDQSKELNILSEQLGKDAVTRVHKLELDNQRMQHELEAAKAEQDKNEREWRMAKDTEAKKKASVICRLEETVKREADERAKLEQNFIETKRERESLQTVVETLKHQNNNLQIEKDTEVESLVKQVSSLSTRAAHTDNQQIDYLQSDNKKLISERTVLQTQLTKLGHEKERHGNTITDLKKKLSVLEESDEKKRRLEKDYSLLQQEMEQFAKLQDEHEALQDELKSSNDQTSNMQRRIDEHNGRLEEAQAENMKLRVENQKMTRKIDSIKNENQTIVAIEQEKDGLKHTMHQMKATIDALQKSQAKQDEMEVKVMTSGNENTKLQRQMDSLTRKLEEVDKENNEIETENKKMQKSIETLKVSARRVNQLEAENLDLEATHHKVERENKSLLREIDRLRQAVEVKDLSIDENSAKLASTERELQKHKKELETVTKKDTKLYELEVANADLASSCMMDKKALIDLREELVQEKVTAEALSAHLETVMTQLQVLGVTANEDGGLAGLERVQLIGSVKETNTVASTKQLYSRSKSMTGDTASRLSTLEAERDELSSQLARLRVATVGSEDKEVALTTQLHQIQDEMVVVSKERASLQVENRTLQSQSSSLLAQINRLQADYSRQESESMKCSTSEKEARQELNQLLADQTRLQRLHGLLQADYDQLVSERDEIKLSERTSRLEATKLRDSAATVSQGQDDILKAKEALEMERENLQTDKKTLANLRSEHSRLKDDFRSLFTANERMKTEYGNLQTDYRVLKTENNNLKLKHTELQGKLGDAREQTTILDVENTKVANRCEVLHQLNLSLEEDRKSLMSQVSLLLSQYHDLLTQTLDDKEHYHVEEREYSDKMNNLRRQKEKLEEKIMEQYKKMENTTPKKKGIGFTLVRKMRKAGSNMFLASGTPGRMPARSSSRHDQDHHDSSSMGSGGNDSIDSGGSSPADNMLRGDTIMEIQSDQLMFRRSLPASMAGIGISHSNENDSDTGNIADNDSLVSYLSSNLPDNDHIPVRDTGPGKDNAYNNAVRLAFEDNRDASFTSSTADRKKSSDNQPRSISRVYLSGGDDPAVGGGKGWRREGEEPKLTSWRRMGDELAPRDNALPPIPARRPSAAGETPPNRPPKPNRSNPTTDDEDAKKDANSEWYEYGCV